MKICSVTDCEAPVKARGKCEPHYDAERRQEAAQRYEDYKQRTGKPSLYRAEYCAQVVDYCATGKSLTAFAGHIGVCRDTITEWGNSHPEFAVAVSRAKAVRADWWEDQACSVAHKGGPGGQAQMVIFGLKNVAPEDFSDRQHVELTGAGGKDLIPEASEDRLSALLERVVGKVIDHEPAPRLITGPDDD